jgi:hypothetical protein
MRDLLMEIFLNLFVFAIILALQTRKCAVDARDFHSHSTAMKLHRAENTNVRSIYLQNLIAHHVFVIERTHAMFMVFKKK